MRRTSSVRLHSSCNNFPNQQSTDARLMLPGLCRHWHTNYMACPDSEAIEIAAVPKNTQMKTTLVPAGILFLLFLSACRHDFGVEQLPKDIIKSVPCPTLYSRILELFPEHTRNSRDVLFNDTVQKKVVLTKDSEVYVTFISEGAGYRN